MKEIIIGVTDCSKYDLYDSWIKKETPQVKTLKLSWKDDSLSELYRCDGILLTGGEDVHPRYYGLPQFLPYCYADDINESRDEMEFEILKFSQEKALPVLGICRGLQVTNVYFGGTLIPDIPTWGKFNHNKLPNDTDRYHRIMIDPNSQLHAITQILESQINSNHHQSVDRVGKGLVASAFSEDGVVEALERKNQEEGAYLTLVQWHPERLLDHDSPLAKNIRNSFINASRQ